MQRKGLFFGAGALVVAAGAIGAGVLVSSNAMAAAGDVGDHALTISMVSVGEHGDAFQCTFDAATLPVLPMAPSAANGEAPAIVTSAVGGGFSGAATVISEGHVIGAGPDGSLPSPQPAGNPGSSGAVIITGSANADGSSSVSQIAADGTITPVNIRQGTPSECAAAQKGLPPAPATAGPADATPADTAVNPKG